MRKQLLDETLHWKEVSSDKLETQTPQVEMTLRYFRTHGLPYVLFISSIEYVWSIYLQFHNDTEAYAFAEQVALHFDHHPEELKTLAFAQWDEISEHFKRHRQN
jgi:hypothetical protein